MQVRLSLFRYEEMAGRSKGLKIEDHIFLGSNYISGIFQATLDDYKEVIDRYLFIGILEEIDLSLAVLASAMGKKFPPLQWLNQSQEHRDSNLHSFKPSIELVDRFRDKNALDYMLYDYCVESLRRMSSEHSSVLDRTSATFQHRR